MNRCLKRRSPSEFVVGDSFARLLTETTQSLVCVSTATARILLFNEACERATGFARDEVIGRDARDFVIPPEERDAFGEFLAYVWTTRPPSPQVGHWMTKDGGRRLIAWSNRPMAATTASRRVAGHDRHRPDRPRAAPRRGRARAARASRSAKLAEIGRLATEQRALRRVATLVASEVSPERVFMAVSEECARVLEVNASASCATRATARRRSSAATTATASTSSSSGRCSRPTSTPRSGACARPGRPRASTTGACSPGRSPRRCSVSATARRRRRRSSSRGALWGAVAIASEDPLPPETENRLGAFCELVSLARRERAGARGPDRLARPRSSRRATSSGAGWSATSTTARSSASCRWR